MSTQLPRFSFTVTSSWFFEEIQVDLSTRRHIKLNRSRIGDAAQWMVFNVVAVLYASLNGRYRKHVQLWLATFTALIMYECIVNRKYQYLFSCSFSTLLKLTTTLPVRSAERLLNGFSLTGKGCYTFFEAVLGNRARKKRRRQSAWGTQGFQVRRSTFARRNVFPILLDDGGK